MELRLCSRCHQVHGGATTCPGCKSALTLADHSIFVGERFGKYQIEAVLGMGGMGVVYRAIHTTLNRPVALKIVLPQDEGGKFQKRFLREAQVLAELKHPNIVEVYDFDVSEWGVPYYVMEYLTGAPLRTLLLENGALDLAECVELLEDIVAGLAFAHRKGVVHRDLKPENIFVTAYDGRAVAKLLDFGIAKLLREERESTRLTRSGTVIGTPTYLAPEQILGRDIGPWTDQYALALTVAEIVIGRAVREGKTFGEICSIEITRPVALDLGENPEVPEAVRAALQRATHPVAAERFPDVLSFLHSFGVAPASGGRERISARIAASETAGAPASSVADATASVTPAFALPKTTPFTPPQSAGRRLPFASDEQTLEAPPAQAPEVRTPAVPAVPMPSPAVRGSRASLGTRRWILVASVLGVVLVAGLTWAVWTRRQEKPIEPAAGGARQTPPAAAALLEHLREIPVPPDATDLLGYSGETLLLAAPSAVYLISTGPSSVPSRIPLPADSEILGPTPEGSLFVRHGARVVIEDFVAGAEPIPWAAGVPRAERVLLSPDGGHLVALEPRGIGIYRRRGSVWERIATVAARRGSSFSAENLARLPVGLSRRHLAFVAGGSLEVVGFADGRPVVSVPMAEARIHSIALSDEVGLVAVGGWFNQVEIFEFAPLQGIAGKRRSIPRRGQTMSLSFIDDEPTLVVAGEGGLRLWRRNAEDLPSWGGANNQLDRIRVCASALATLDRRRRVVDLFAYRGFDIEKSLPVAEREIWALAADATGKTLFVGGGGADGQLYRLRPADGKIEKHALHDLGITSLALAGDHLASASDDKTIAVWKLPSMQVVWRSQAHSYLVNQLLLQGEPIALWSSSSDGSVKKWAWPQLQEIEEVSAEKLVGGRLPLQAFWVSPDEDTILVGSWESSLVVLTRTDAPSGSAWKAEVLPVASPGIYGAVDLSAIRAVLLVGINFPSGVYLYDLEAHRLHELESLASSSACASASPEGSEAYVFGAGMILRYRFSRDEKGISYDLAKRVHTGLGSILAATRLGSTGRFALGDEAGAVHLVSASALDAAPLFRAALPLAPE